MHEHLQNPFHRSTETGTEWNLKRFRQKCFHRQGVFCRNVSDFLLFSGFKLNLSGGSLRHRSIRRWVTSGTRRHSLNQTLAAVTMKVDSSRLWLPAWEPQLSYWWNKRHFRHVFDVLVLVQSPLRPSNIVVIMTQTFPILFLLFHCSQVNKWCVWTLTARLCVIQAVWRA